MPLPVIADVFRCVFHWSGLDSDEEVVSVQHFRSSTLDEGGVATALDANTQTDQFPIESSIQAFNVDVTALDGVSASQTFGLDNWIGAGGASEQIPGFNILVLGHTILRGPAHRGRLFLPGVAENIVTNGLLDAANQAATATAWGNYLAALALDGVSWGVASYVNVEFTVYSSISIPRMLGVIRRRRNVA